MPPAAVRYFRRDRMNGEKNLEEIYEEKSEEKWEAAH
jgi:hypothetical protein